MKSIEGANPPKPMPAMDLFCVDGESVEISGEQEKARSAIYLRAGCIVFVATSSAGAKSYQYPLIPFSSRTSASR